MYWPSSFGFSIIFHLPPLSAPTVRPGQRKVQYFFLADRHQFYSTHTRVHTYDTCAVLWPLCFVPYTGPLALVDPEMNKLTPTPTEMWQSQQTALGV